MTETVTELKIPSLRSPKKNFTSFSLTWVCRVKLSRNNSNLSVSMFFGFVNLRVIFRNTCRIKSFFPYKDRLSRSLMSKGVYKASCWNCDDFYIGKTKSRLHDRKTEHFKVLTKDCHTSAIADHISSTGHNIKWDHFEILETGKSDIHCRIN